MEKEQVKKYQDDIKNGCFNYSYLEDIVVEGKDSKKLSMGIISDIHLYPFNPRQVDRTAEGINHFANEGVDLIFINGDVTQAGREIEYAEWEKVKRKIDLKDSLLHVSMGNHELALGDTKDLFIKYYKQLPDAHYKINGFHVIKASPDGDIHKSEYKYVSPWLESRLAIAKEDTGDLPIFVFFHHPVENTYYSTRSEDGYWGNMQKEVFDDYPMVITFGGHNHAPSNHPQAVWQDKYTAVNIPSMYYAEGPMGVGSTTYYEEVSDVYQGLFLEADAHQVTIKVYDFSSQTYTNHIFQIDTAHPEDFAYCEGRDVLSLAPVFPRNALLSLETGEDFVEVSFKQARIPEEDVLMDIVDQYCFELRNDKGEIINKSNEWSHWIRHPQPESFNYRIDKLEAGQAYNLRIVPVNAFRKEGKPLEVKFKCE